MSISGIFMRRCAIFAFAAAFAALPATAATAQGFALDFNSPTESVDGYDTPSAFFPMSTMGGLVTESSAPGTDSFAYDLDGGYFNSADVGMLNDPAEPALDGEAVGLIVAAVIVPEPTTLALMLSGIAALCLVGKKRRRA